MSFMSNHRRSGPWGRWYVRLPVKWAIFLTVTFLVLFPSPRQFAKHVSHIRNMQAMIEPDAPEIEGWKEELRKKNYLSGGVSEAAEAQRGVERFVYEKVRYEWDWNLWGSSDYLPTVREMFEKANASDGVVREDCDGRAVIAASLMASLGYKPTLVTDLRHVWVTTPEGAWMGPGGAAAMRSTPEGNRIDLVAALRDVPSSLSYGVAVFPFVREMIILVTAYLLMLRRKTAAWAAAAGFVLLVQGLLFMRLGFLAPEAVSRNVSSWPAWVGMAHIAGGLWVLLFGSRWRIARFFSSPSA